MKRFVLPVLLALALSGGPARAVDEQSAATLPDPADLAADWWT